MNIHEFSFLLSVRPGMVRKADIPDSNRVRIYPGPNVCFSVMVFSLLGDEQ